MANGKNDFENPLLNDEVDVKDYGKLGMNLTEEQKRTPIPEPVFSPPPFQFESEEATQPQQQSGGGAKETNSSFNESLEGASDKEKKAQAQHFASAAINLYGYGMKAAESLGKISQSKMEDLEDSGVLNLNATIKLNDGTTTDIRSFILRFNEEASGVFALSEEFINNVTPLLERILAKNGIGVTDEELLAYFVIMDIVSKVPALMSLMRSRKKTLELLVIRSKESSASTNKEEQITPTNTEKPKAESPLQDGTVENVKTDGSVEIVEIEDVTPKKNGRGRKPKPKAE